MSPNFLALSQDTTVAEAFEEIRRSQVAPEALSVTYIFDEDGRLCATVSVVRLLKSSTTARLRDVAEPDPITLRADADLHEIGRKMSDFDLAATPVVDDDHRMIGVITVDDVLELLLPVGWRRELGLASTD
jgi:Mg/Co/Ni transporter MgtE